MNQYNADSFPDQPLPPRLSQETLLDRYHSHTIKCKSCSTALAKIRQIRRGVAVVGAIAWAIIPLLALFFDKTATISAIFSSGVALIAGIGWFGLGRLERRFYEGRTVPPRNLP
ncbi:MAG: hypothetical protein RIM23_12245 [Coleofasciculus sp. G3-WIS-01]|uniref:hypothetical protein n=1 Tax=Coleofasciculus sp. G3-WIS-01 TaxID=3069528 RepID=UPI003303E152